MDPRNEKPVMNILLRSNLSSAELARQPAQPGHAA
jgi:hypothetical protein